MQLAEMESALMNEQQKSEVSERIQDQIMRMNDPTFGELESTDKIFMLERMIKRLHACIVTLNFEKSGLRNQKVDLESERDKNKEMFERS